MIEATVNARDTKIADYEQTRRIEEAFNLSGPMARAAWLLAQLRYLSINR